MSAETVTNKRPLEITILAWIILIYAVFRLLGWAAIYLIPEARENLAQLGVPGSQQAVLHLPQSAHIAFSLIGSVLMFIAAIAVLKAALWGRWLIVIWGAVAIVFSYLVTSAVGYLVPKLVVYGVMVVILFSPRSQRYFAGR